MKGSSNYRSCYSGYLHNDINRVIETIIDRYRIKNVIREFRHIYYFDFDNDIGSFVLGLYEIPMIGPFVAFYRNGKIYRMNGRIHRKNGPAILGPDNHKEWFDKNERHRDDGPAIEWANGDKEWFFNNQRHRDPKKGPAIERANGAKLWYFNNQLHREDGPAIEWTDGTKDWYFNGQRHRDPKEGSAIEYGNNHQNEYWEFGNRIIE